MDKKSKTLLITFFLLVLFFVSLTYHNTFIAKNFHINAEVECDPAIESCFARPCDPEFEYCAQNSEDRTNYYKLINKSLKNVVLCNQSDELCEEIACQVGETDCTQTLCDSENVPEGETCYGPSLDPKSLPAI